MKTKVANTRKKKFNCNKNEKIITFLNKCTSLGSALDCEGFQRELAKPVCAIKKMQEGDVLMCRDKLPPLGLNQECKHTFQVGQNPLWCFSVTITGLLLKSFYWGCSLEEYDKVFDWEEVQVWLTFLIFYQTAEECQYQYLAYELERSNFSWLILLYWVINPAFPFPPPFLKKKLCLVI